MKNEDHACDKVGKKKISPGGQRARRASLISEEIGILHRGSPLGPPGSIVEGLVFSGKMDW